MASTRGDRRNTDAEADSESPSGTRCADCATSDPQHRARHHLRIVQQGGVDALRPHLTAQYVQNASKPRPDVVDSICAWAANLVEQFSHMVDPETGATIPWWEARQYMATHKDDIARRAYSKAPEQYRTQRGQREDVVPPPRMREPGEEDMGGWPDEERLEPLEPEGA